MRALRPLLEGARRCAARASTSRRTSRPRSSSSPTARSPLERLITRVEPLERRARGLRRAARRPDGDEDPRRLSRVTGRPFDLSGRTALVTGCRRGIGRAAAVALAAAGADVVGVSASLEPEERGRREVEALGRSFAAYRCDFADRARRAARCARRSRAGRRRHPRQQRGHDRAQRRRPSTRDELWDRVLEVEPHRAVRAHARARPARCSSAAAARSSSSRRCSRSRAGSPCPGYAASKGGDRAADEGARERVGGARRQRQRDRARLHRAPTTRRRCGTTRCARRQILDRIPAGRWGSRRTSPARSSSSPRRPPTTSTASCSRSTAAGSRGDRLSGRSAAPRRAGAERPTTPTTAERACRALARGRALVASRSRSARTPRPRRFGARPRSTASSSAPARCSPPSRLDAAVEAGAGFAVAPGTNDEVVVGACRRARPPVRPRGRRPPTEIDRARRLGCGVVKLFPAPQLGGPAFLAAVSAVVPGRAVHADRRRRAPTTLADYLALPSVLACGGSWIVEPELLREGASTRSSALAREAVELAGDVSLRPRARSAATTSSRSAR